MVMNLEDETLLTAYLDGELDDAGRHRVEAATAASPGLARRLRDLAEARDMVESLSRPPAQVDVSAFVMSRITAPVRPWAFRVRVTRVVSPRWLAVGSGLAAAASLLVSLSLLSHRGDLPTRVRGAVDDITNLVNHMKPELVPAPPVAVPNHPFVPNESARGATPVEIATTRSLEDENAERQWLRDQDRLDSLLDRPEVHKIVVTVDQLGPREKERLERAIDQIMRKNAEIGQITVAPGIVIDPAAQHGAFVVALLLDEDERGRLESKLAAEFASVGELKSASALEVMQLADQRHATFSEPYVVEASPPVGQPDRLRPATKAEGYTTKPEGHVYPAPQPPVEPGASMIDPLTIRPRRTVLPRAEARSSAQDAGAPAAPADTRRLATVLIWLAPRQASGEF
jgi:hypothetical protein